MTRDVPGPAYRIETERLVLRCFAPTDHEALTGAILDSIEHLLPYMPWVLHEPVTEERRIEWLRTQRGHFDLGGDYAYSISLRESGAMIGSALLHQCSEVSEREVGFWVRRGYLRQGVATEACSALIRVGFEIEDLDAIDLRCDVRNEASARVAQKLGFVGPSLDPLAFPDPRDGKHDVHVYGLSRVAYAASPAYELAYRAYDVLDRRIV